MRSKVFFSVRSEISQTKFQPTLLGPFCHFLACSSFHHVSCIAMISACALSASPTIVPIIFCSFAEAALTRDLAFQDTNLRSGILLSSFITLMSASVVLTLVSVSCFSASSWSSDPSSFSIFASESGHSKFRF